MKRKTIILVSVLTGVLIIAAAGTGLVLSKIKRFNKYMEQVQINEINPESIPDGIYPGFTDAGPIIVNLSVTIENGRIAGIDLARHTNGKGGAASEIINTVIEKQSLKVDMVSGASYSSTVILDTIEQALSLND